MIIVILTIFMFSSKLTGFESRIAVRDLRDQGSSSSTIFEVQLFQGL